MSDVSSTSLSCLPAGFVDYNPVTNPGLVFICFNPILRRGVPTEEPGSAHSAVRLLVEPKTPENLALRNGDLGDTTAVAFTNSFKTGAPNGLAVRTVDRGVKDTRKL